MYKPTFRITPYLLNLVDEASYIRSWIDHAPLQVSWLPVLQKEARAKTAHYSTSIEGNLLTLAQVRALDRGEKIGAVKNQEAEVTNYLKAMRWIENNAEDDLDEKCILHLHRILTKDLLPEEKCGKYKEKQNFIIDENGIKVFTPPSPQETPHLVAELVEWLHARETKMLHCLPVCAIFHHRLVSIHPFSDGNGRLARALGTMILFKRDYDLHHIFSLDEFFASNRKRYYQKLQQVRGLDGDMTYWIEYAAEGVVQTLKNVKKRVEDLQVMASHPVHLSTRQEEALRMLRDSPSLRVNEFQERLNITRSRVNQILTPLIKSGLVTKEGESRATSYKLNLH